MNWLSALTAAALFAAACNLDTVLLSAGFAARGVVLRRGYGLVIAALTAEGVTEIEEIHHIERGYEDFVEKLQALGASIEKRVLPDGLSLPKAL